MFHIHSKLSTSLWMHLVVADWELWSKKILFHTDTGCIDSREFFRMHTCYKASKWMLHIHSNLSTSLWMHLVVSAWELRKMKTLFHTHTGCIDSRKLFRMHTCYKASKVMLQINSKLSISLWMYLVLSAWELWSMKILFHTDTGCIDSKKDFRMHRCYKASKMNAS